MILPSVRARMNICMRLRLRGVRVLLFVLEYLSWWLALYGTVGAAVSSRGRRLRFYFFYCLYLWWLSSFIFGFYSFRSFYDLVMTLQLLTHSFEFDRYSTYMPVLWVFNNCCYYGDGRCGGMREETFCVLATSRIDVVCRTLSFSMHRVWILDR